MSALDAKKTYIDEYGNTYKKVGKFWRQCRNGEWFVISGEPLFKLTEIK